MDIVEAREKKRQRTVTSCHRLVDTEEDMTDAVEEVEDGNLGKPKDDLESMVLVTDAAAADYDDEEIEGEYSVYCIRAASLTREPGLEDEVDWAVTQYKCSKSHCIMLHCLTFVD